MMNRGRNDGSRTPAQTGIRTLLLILALLQVIAAVSFRTAVQAADTEAEIQHAAPEETVRGDQGKTTQEKTVREEHGETTEEKTVRGEQDKTAQQETAQDGTQQEETQQEETEAEPDGYYTVVLKDIRPDLPEGGRVYDGTDEIRLVYETEIRRERTENGNGETEEEDIPDYTVRCEAHLDGCDAGERKVIYSLSIDTLWPDHIRLSGEQEYPEIRVEVRKAVLSVKIADGMKAYMDPAEPEYIEFDSLPEVTVSGFVKDAEGKEMIPADFEAPEIDVDTSVLKQSSPMYEYEDTEEGTAEEVRSAKRTVCRYRNALIMKRKPDGLLSGDPTANYEFCCDPEDDRYSPGSVTVTRRGIQYGDDYSVEGEDGSFLITGEDSVIVRAGSRLYADPVKGSGYNSGAVSGELTGEGVYTFRLQKKDHAGRVIADSMETDVRYTADASAPAAAFTVPGTSGEGDILYSASSADTAVAVSGDDLSGIRSVRCRILKTRLTAENLQTGAGDPAGEMMAGPWRETGQSGNITLTEEGIYRIECEVTDGVGNRSLNRSPCIVIDRTAPSIRIQGIEDGSANAGAVIVTADVYDAMYRSGSMKAVMTASWGGLVPEMTLLSNGSTGCEVCFADFAYRKEADAVYTLEVSACDLAGNESIRTVTFSVNRFGSAYRLGKQTAQELLSYYHSRPFAVSFIETNLDAVPNARVFLRNGSSFRELVPGDGNLSVKEKRGKKGNRYTYTVSEDTFEEDGRYEVMLLTTDAAGNSSDSAAQGIPVRFAVDRTAPQCLITGIRDGGRYRTEKLTAVLEIRDNLALSGAEIYRDGKLFRMLNAEELTRTGGIMKLPIDEKDSWQTLQIRAADCAGNTYWTPEMTFLVSMKSGADSPAPPVKRLTARQLVLIRGWIRTLTEQLRKAAENYAADGEVNPEELRQILRKDLAAGAEAGGLSAYESQVSAGELQGSRRRNLLIAVAGTVLPVLLLCLIVQRSRRRGRV